MYRFPRLCSDHRQIVAGHEIAIEICDKRSLQRKYLLLEKNHKETENLPFFFRRFVIMDET